MKAQANLHEIWAYDFLMANMHDVHVNQDEYHECNQEPSIDSMADNAFERRQLNATRSSSNGNTPHAPPGDICQVMSKSSKLSVNIGLMK
jgi:hypothetical protein